MPGRLHPARQFLSTLPARGATANQANATFAKQKFLSTLPARGATPRPGPRSSRPGHFYPRSPRGERRPRCRLCRTLHCISIHAPREGSDTKSRNEVNKNAHFYPRSPRGERLGAVQIIHHVAEFLSTLPARGATRPDRPGCRRRRISIHAPREGSDRCKQKGTSDETEFLSTLPARGATKGS